MPVSTIGLLPLMPKVMSVPSGVVILTVSAPSIASAMRRDRAATSPQSASMEPKSMSSSKSGMLAYLAPASEVSRSRKRVWLVE